MNWILRAGLIFGAAALVTGCSVAGGELIRQGEPTGIIEVVNATSNNITAILISDCDNFTYGLNRLANGEILVPGESKVFVVSTGCWDVDAGYGNGTGYAEARQRMNVVAGGGVRYTVHG